MVPLTRRIDMSDRHPIVIFDMDNTITRRDSMIDLLASSVRRAPHRLLKTPAAVVRTAWQLSRGHRTQAKESLLRLAFEGLNHTEVQEVSARAADRVPLNTAVLGRIAQHHAAGDEIWIVSASPLPVVEHVAGRVAISNIIASELEFDGGIATGRLDGANCRGYEKLLRLDAVLPDDWRSSAVAYSDDLDADGPLLAASSRAVLVRGDSLEDVRVG